MHHPPHFITVAVGASRVQVPPRRRSLAGVRCRPRPSHVLGAAGKQPADRKSSLSNTNKTMTSESWLPSQQIPCPSTPQRETQTHTQTHRHRHLDFLWCCGHLAHGEFYFVSMFRAVQIKADWFICTIDRIKDFNAMDLSKQHTVFFNGKVEYKQTWDGPV